MGRAYRVLKRTAHLTVQVAERPQKIAPVGKAGEAGKKRGRQSKKKNDRAKE
jgi:hypothetical protein